MVTVLWEKGNEIISMHDVVPLNKGMLIQSVKESNLFPQYLKYFLFYY